MKLSKRISSISLKIQALLILTTFLFLYQNFTISARANTYTNIDPDTAYSMINNSTLYPDLVILDVRTQDEYNSNHICNATLIPHMELESRISELSPYNDTEIIVYCASGFRSQAASNILVSYNFTKIYNMLGGIVAWILEGYEFCTNQNGQLQPTISSSFILYLISFLVSSVILITFYKKKISKK
ncbi:MAG: rhodanese-like domain-containing protein [Candidatus Hodarchaeota archaeon]